MLSHALTYTEVKLSAALLCQAFAHCGKFLNKYKDDISTVGDMKRASSCVTPVAVPAIAGAIRVTMGCASDIIHIPCKQR